MGNQASGSGLEGVVVADTAISDVDGERGRLVIAGFEVEQLAKALSFEQAAACVLAAGTGAAAGDHGAIAIGPHRVAAWQSLRGLGDALDHVDAMDALRAGLGHLRSTDDDRGDALAAIGAAAVYVAAWHRRRTDREPIPPDPSLGHAADYLRMTLGEPASAAAALALDAYLVTVIDHAMSASTLAARVIASTGANAISALIGGVGALSGPLHGGAPGPVLDMLDAVGTPAHAEPWLIGELEAGRRIMGMGHRVYRVRDPRAAVLEGVVRSIPSAASNRLSLARAVEDAATKILRERKPERPLAANVEFYTAVLLDAIGLSRDQFAATFAVSRLAGWSAHVLEQRRTGRLIRPASRYVGALPFFNPDDAPHPDGMTPRSQSV